MQYYYFNTSAKQGPFDQEIILQLAQSGTIHPDTVLENTEGEQLLAKNMEGIVFAQTSSSLSAFCTSTSPYKSNYQRSAIFANPQGLQTHLSIENLRSKIKNLTAFYLTCHWILVWFLVCFSFLVFTNTCAEKDTIANVWNWVFGIGVGVSMISLNPGFTVSKFFSFLIILVSSITILVILVKEESESGTIIFMGITLITLIIFCVSSLCLLYRLWESVPFDYASTTPGKAVGLLFVPVFNLYWNFVAWCSLGANLNRGLSMRNITSSAKTGLMLTSILYWFAYPFIIPISSSLCESLFGPLFGAIIGSILFPAILGLFLFLNGITSYSEAADAYLQHIQKERE